jgi:mono/diheme cytochrome c family protein
MGLVNPLLHNYVDWPWFVASQFVYGIIASIVIMRSEKIPIAPRGPGGDEGEPSVPAGWLGCIVICLFALPGCSDAKLPGKPTLGQEYVMPEEITDFKDLYGQRCAGCHGADGTLDAGPPLNDPLFLALVSSDELTTVIANGRKLMPAWSQSSGGPLTEKQIASLVEGIKQRKWDNKSSTAISSIPPNAPPLQPAIEQKGDQQRGEKVFAAACASCHGDNGEGTDMAGAVNNPALLTLVSDTLLRRIIITGRPDLEMPDFADASGRASDFKPLTTEDINDLIALLNHWRESPVR